jgi:hypothetical protein
MQLRDISSGSKNKSSEEKVDTETGREVAKLGALSEIRGIRKIVKQPAAV